MPIEGKGKRGTEEEAMGEGGRGNIMGEGGSSKGSLWVSKGILKGSYGARQGGLKGTMDEEGKSEGALCRYGKGKVRAL